MVKKLNPATLLPALTTNTRYLKKLKFITKRKEAAAAGRRSGGKAKKKKATKKSGSAARGSGKKAAKAAAKKSSGVSAKKKKTPVHGTATKTKRKTINNNKSGNGDARDTALQQQPKQKQLSPEEVDQQMIAQAIRGDEGTHNTSLAAGAAAEAGVEDFVQYPCLPFLEDYAEQKRSEIVSADTLLSNAHAYFKDLGKRESAMRRAAAKRLKELKAINRRGGDRDGFRYVVPRNVKEVVRQMTQNAEGPDEAAVDTTHLTSTFGGDEAQDTSEPPMHRKRRRKSCFSDFYQFQVSKRWTRNAESFLNRGRAHKSMFEASRPQRSIKKF
ncbi:hypothetical protein TraAM80_05789 [Trypanosoma rangeli]|uniref:Uncharacterized protein n=1 Tax=Trypanosoma rangeli TaxID=5698 RepID=A0A422NDW4_TRYRA|nr:uncharacterized protein TraAM80_05789 [Trypanosoma rangeli]RNF03690.1 hypothetical protein TraAM80_05789 [Trypanosoma rangeli]|eukprot:RNF03690.1 hypothetical protein TraAM80_05789 [Trypanosoma rangeli]